jgi:hypothetical protein
VKHTDCRLFYTRERRIIRSGVISGCNRLPPLAISAVEAAQMTVNYYNIPTVGIRQSIYSQAPEFFARQSAGEVRHGI